MDKTYFCEAITSINIASGVVRLAFGIQDHSQTTQAPEGTMNLKNDFIVAMPILGFLYSVNVISAAMNDERTQGLLKRMSDAELIPPPQENADTMDNKGIKKN